MRVRLLGGLLVATLAATGSLAQTSSTGSSPSVAHAVMRNGCPGRPAVGAAATRRPRRFIAYLNAHDAVRGLQDLRQRPAVDVVSVQWFRFTTTGAVRSLPLAPTGILQRRIVASLHAQRIKVFATITNRNDGGDWDPELARAVFSQSQQAVSQLVRHAVARRYDGIDLDIEKLDATDMDDYVQFLRQLTSQLHRHRRGLSVYLKPRQLTADGWKQHADDVARTVDQIRLGTYNYQLSTNPYPEPFSPYDAVERDLCEVLLYVPQDKVALGLTAKGVGWMVGDDGRRVGGARGVQWLDLRRELPDGTVFGWDSKAKATTFCVPVPVTPGSCSRQGWLDDGRSARHKLLLAEQYDVDAFLFRLGGSDPLIWTYVDRWVAGTLR